MRKRLRLLSYNIHKGVNPYTRQSNIEDAIALIKHYQPDIILFQEVMDFHEAGVKPPCCHIAAKVNLQHYYGANAFYAHGDHGNATFTRFKIEKAVNLDITQNRFEYRGALYTKIHLTPNEHVHIFNVHFSLTSRQRKRQLDCLKRFISQFCDDGKPVFIGGDFNDFTGVIAKKFVHQNEFHQVVPDSPKTWPSKRPLFSLDHIFYRSAEPIASETLKQKSAIYSDHLALLADFKHPATQK